MMTKGQLSAMPGASRLFNRPASCLPRSAARPSLKLHASSATAGPAPAAEDAEAVNASSFELCCPICMTTKFSMLRMPTRTIGLSCTCCNRTFNADKSYVDLTLSSGIKPKVYARKEWGGQELFRSPLISFVYERGWRQGFSWAGFPGEEKEYAMAMDYLKPAYGDVIVDMSCGSGLFTRRFIKSGKFSGVVAADFSESMLQQTASFLKEDKAISASTSQPNSQDIPPYLLLRADVGRLPFLSGSVAAIHAGAAIHCWPNPQAALAEISRVLKPGGVFVASTFMVPSAPLGQALGSDDAVRPLNEVLPNFPAGVGSEQYKWWQEDELRDLCDTVGLQEFKRQRQWRFILFSATKPDISAPLQ